jgi:hypothetical protein
LELEIYQRLNYIYLIVKIEQIVQDFYLQFLAMIFILPEGFTPDCSGITWQKVKVIVGELCITTFEREIHITGKFIAA